MATTLLWGLLGWVVFPLWLASGLADYLCHWRTDLARTSGPHESWLHALQTAEIAVPALALLFLEVSAATLLLMVAGAVAHSFTAWRDVRYASRLRRIPPFEQFVHAFLIVLPLVALALIVVLHWPVATAMFDVAGAADWSLRLREPPFAPATIAAVLGASFLFGLVPGAWELLHARRVSKLGTSPP
jgi:hypothetical protein